MNYSQQFLDSVLKSYEGSKFVMEIPVRSHDAVWHLPTGLLFRAKESHPQGSEWFFITTRDGRSYISDGILYYNHLSTEGITGLIDDSIESPIYSVNRHDMACTPGRSCIDGGRDYTKLTLGQGTRTVTIKCDSDGVLYWV